MSVASPPELSVVYREVLEITASSSRLRRTPLEMKPDGELCALGMDELGDNKLFAYVGSLATGISGSGLSVYRSVHTGRYHLPVFDVPGGASSYKDGSGVLLKALPPSELGEDRATELAGRYDARSKLQLVQTLGKLGLVCEFTELPFSTEVSGHFGTATEYKGSMVSSLAIGINPYRPNVFEVVPSDSGPKSGLYVQWPWSKGAYIEVVGLLEAMGLVDPDWANKTRTLGMGILKTPWAIGKPSG